jgi:hypothetical protein
MSISDKTRWIICMRMQWIIHISWLNQPMHVMQAQPAHAAAEACHTASIGTCKLQCADCWPYHNCCGQGISLARTPDTHREPAHKLPMLQHHKCHFFSLTDMAASASAILLQHKCHPAHNCSSHDTLLVYNTLILLGSVSPLHTQDYDTLTPTTTG